MFTTLVALFIIAIQIATVLFVVLWIKKSPILEKIYKYSPAILTFLFSTSMIGSFIYEYGFGYEPCVLCWYQRLAIFAIAILSLTGNIKTNKTLQKQVIVLGIVGLLVALLHNYIDIVPNSVDICGTGVSCLKRYIYEFGYITIPMMSLTVLLSGILLAIFAQKHNQKITVQE